jgi:hypothetical protein
VQALREIVTEQKYSEKKLQIVDVIHLASVEDDLKKVHCKKRFAIFPSPAGMSLTKLSLAGNNLNIPVQGEFGQ